MAYEVEIKFLHVDFSQLRERLSVCGAFYNGKHLERNLVFDTSELTFKHANMLLRLREKQYAHKTQAILTLKRPPQTEVPDDVKVYDEQETHVSNAEGMRHILEGLGYHAAFRYDKVREEWSLGQVDICLDSLPFGDVVELEGEREAIFAVAKQLELSMKNASTETYHAVNCQFRKAAGLPPDDNFIFDEDILVQILNTL